MARLLTPGDRYHKHAILGSLALLHLLYRLALALYTGNSFPRSEPPAFTACCLLVHALLHGTSFLLHVPTKRNITQPMIWPEFRAHSAVFAYRHLVATAMKLAFGDTFGGVLGGLLLILAFSALADAVTTRIGDKERRTTNAMPYPTDFDEQRIIDTKYFYAVAQTQASAWVAFGTATMAFIPLLAIELAPFLMTLVRKGKASSWHYHFYYRWALLAVYLVCMRAFVKGLLPMGWAIAACAVAFELGRFRLRISKYALWPIAIGVYSLLVSLGSSVIIERLFMVGVLNGFLRAGFRLSTLKSGVLAAIAVLLLSVMETTFMVNRVNEIDMPPVAMKSMLPFYTSAAAGTNEKCLNVMNASFTFFQCLNF